MSPTTWRSLGQTRPMPYLMMTWLLTSSGVALYNYLHDNVIIWKHFPRNRPFVQGIHRSPVNSPHKGQWRGALMFSFTCAWAYSWVNNEDAGYLRRHCSHYDAIVMYTFLSFMGLLLMTYIFSLLKIVNTVHLTNILGGYLFSIYCVLLWCGTGRFLSYPSRSILNLHWRRCPQDVLHL